MICRWQRREQLSLFTFELLLSMKRPETACMLAAQKYETKKYVIILFFDTLFFRESRWLSTSEVSWIDRIGSRRVGPPWGSGDYHVLVSHVDTPCVRHIRGALLYVSNQFGTKLFFSVQFWRSSGSCSNISNKAQIMYHSVIAPVSWTSDPFLCAISPVHIVYRYW